MNFWLGVKDVSSEQNGALDNSYNLDSDVEIEGDEISESAHWSKHTQARRWEQRLRSRFSGP